MLHPVMWARMPLSKRIYGCWGLAAILFMGCNKTGKRPSSDVQQHQDELAFFSEACLQACAHLENCQTSDKEAAQEPPSLDTSTSSPPPIRREESPPESFDPAQCQQACLNMQRNEGDLPPTPQTSKALTRCNSLLHCTSIRSCLQASSLDAALHLAPHATLNASQQSTEEYRSCEGLCSLSANCGEEEKYAQQSCVSQCMDHFTTEDTDDISSCMLLNDCVSMNECISGSPQIKISDLKSNPTAISGISPLCGNLCDRSIRCAAGDEELSERALGELRESLISSWVECVLPCEVKLRSDSPEAIESCLAKESCEDFWTCSEDI